MSSFPYALDSSLAERITCPSETFRDFLRHFFSDPQIWIRNESDFTLLDRLSGEERSTAIEMIALNVRTRRDHIIDAAAYLHLADAVPPLEEMLAQTTDPYRRLIIAKALQTLNALDAGSLLNIMLAVMKHGTWSETLDVLTQSYCIFPPPVARRLVDTGLHREDFGIRFSALDALIAIFSIEQHGGHFTPALRQDIFAEKLAANTVGSGVPKRYDEAQYFLGDAVFADTGLFASRLDELARKYPAPA